MLKTLRRSKQDKLRAAQVLLSVGSFAGVWWPSPFLYGCHQDGIRSSIPWSNPFPRLKTQAKLEEKLAKGCAPLSTQITCWPRPVRKEQVQGEGDTRWKERIVGAAVLCACVEKETIVAGCLQSWYCKPHDRWVKCWLQSSNIWNSE